MYTPTEKEIEFIKINYPLIGLKGCMNALNLSKNVVRYVASKNKVSGLDPNSNKKWTEYEINFLKENFNLNWPILSEKLNKTKISIYHKLYRLKLIREDSILSIIKENKKIDKFISINPYKGHSYYVENLNINKKRIRDSFFRLKIKFNKSKWNNKEINYIINNGNNIVKCCEFTKRNQDHVAKKIKDLNNDWIIKYRNMTISNIECYLLGYIWADGHVSTYNVSLTAIISDMGKILPLFESLNQNWKNRISNRNMVIINHNIEFARILSNYNFHIKSHSIPTKLLNKLNDIQKKYFFRGLSDGDGCFYFSKKPGTYQYTINSTYDQDWKYVSDVFDKLEIRWSIQRLIRKRKDKEDSRHSCIRITNKEGVIKFGDFLYSNYDNIGLERKFLKYKVIKSRF